MFNDRSVRSIDAANRQLRSRTMQRTISSASELIEHAY